MNSMKKIIIFLIFAALISGCKSEAKDNNAFPAPEPAIGCVYGDARFTLEDFIPNSVGIPYVFEDGEKVDATRLNVNFAYILGRLNLYKTYAGGQKKFIGYSHISSHGDTASPVTLYFNNYFDPVIINADGSIDSATVFEWEDGKFVLFAPVTESGFFINPPKGRVFVHGNSLYYYPPGATFGSIVGRDGLYIEVFEKELENTDILDYPLSTPIEFEGLKQPTVLPVFNPEIIE